MPKRSQRRVRPDPNVQHGTVFAYRKGCSCPECTERIRQYNEDCKRRNRERGPDRHGTDYIYQKYGCRCEPCRAAAADARAARNARNYKKAIPRGEHGKLNTYKTWGCRCAKCRAVGAEDRRLKRVEAGLPVRPVLMTKDARQPRAVVQRELIKAKPTGRCEVCGKVGFDFLGGRRCYEHRPGGLMGTLV